MLLSIAGKLLARILLDRLNDSITGELLPESQCGFRINRGTNDMVFVLRQIQEKCKEQNKPLYVTFVDLAKAFDTVSRKGLWQILQKLGCPPKFLKILTELHETQLGRVRIGEEMSKPFSIGNGVKQGCVLAPTLFSIFFSTMLNQASEEMHVSDNIFIRTRFNGSLFNLHRLRASSKVSLAMIRELLFADDAALLAHSEKALQHITACFAEAAEIFGLEVSIKKTVILHQPVNNVTQNRPAISIGASKLDVVEDFTYLGCVVSADAKLDKDIANRLDKANKALGKLNKRVWYNKNLRTDTKLKVYKAIILPTLLYGAESWVHYRKHLRSLDRFHQRCLRKIIKVHWFDFVSNNEVLKRTKCLSIHAILQKTQLRWAGHVSRMGDHRLPKITLFGELATGFRTRGSPKFRYKDSLKQTLKSCRINHRNWVSEAADRKNWRQKIFKGTMRAEAGRRVNNELLREKRKQKAVQQNNHPSN